MVEVSERLAVADLGLEPSGHCGVSSRPSRVSSKVGPASLHAAGVNAGALAAPKKRSLTIGLSGSTDTGAYTGLDVTGSMRKARRVSPGSGSVASRRFRVLDKPGTGTSNFRESALLALVASADHESADSDAAGRYSCSSCGVSLKSSRSLSEHMRKAHRSTATGPAYAVSGTFGRHRRKSGSGSPRSASPASDTFDANEHGACSEDDRPTPR
eukprot:scaffold217736_cov46-Prasinocladus_malaysianus.AAC.1